MTSPKKRLLFLLIVLIVKVQTGFSQQLQDEDYNKMVTPTTGVIAGKVIDEHGKGIPYATLYVLSATDSLTKAYGITTQEGDYAIRDVPFGSLILKIDYVGYRTHFSPVFVLTKEKPVLKLQKMKLDQSATMLGSVEIKAQVEMLESNLDKKVFNVASSITAEGATAVEVLEEIPSVDVDLEGNVTLRGSENITILIDGRPTNMTLDQIPANLIESIEVITNPSARLEPDGMAGILNVVLKKRKQSGFNGLVSLRGSMLFFQKKPYFNNYNGNINLNYSYGNINVFFNYDFRSFGRNNAGTMERTSWFGDDSTYLFQNNWNENQGYSHNLRTGIDWTINPKNTLSWSIGYNYNQRNSESEMDVENDNILLGEYTIFERYLQTSLDENTSHNISTALNYKKTFKMKGRELTADLYYTKNIRNSLDSTAQAYEIPFDQPSIYQLSKTLGDNNTATAQVDFVTPIGQGGRIETGYKFSYRSIGENYHFYTGTDSIDIEEDMNHSNHFVFSEIINAAYFIYSNTFWEKLKIQLGVRGEIANTKSDLQSADTAYYKSYFNAFPTVHIRYDINKAHSLQLSYSRRVTRPSIWQLNPFVDISDKLNHRAGNPNLTPEFVNSFELGYLMMIKKSSLNFTGFYRQRDDIISRYTEIFQDSVNDDVIYTLTSYRNLKKSQNIGFELVYGQQLWKFWRITLSGSFYRVLIDGEELIDEYLTRDWSWNARLNQTFNLKNDWSIQVNFRYRAPSLTTGSMGWGTGGVGQGRRSNSYSLDLGVKKSFFKKSFTVNLNIRNLLSSYKTYITTYSHVTQNGYDAYSVREKSSLQISLTLSYKINNYKRRPDKEEGVDEEEME